MPSREVHVSRLAEIHVYALIADRMRIFLARGSGPKLMNKASAAIFMLLASWVLWNTAQPFL